MSHPMIKTACVVAGFAVAALAATSAQAAKPLSVKQKNQMAEAMAHNQNAKAKGKSAPKTMAQAAKTETLAAGGSGSNVEVPEELHNYLSVQHNADGTLRIIESDGPAAPVLNAPETYNEK